ncbi:hypothetical protein [Hymenobacter chitinivorans]|uniref:Outer membrane protein with beta-barrel domain n=1 Tax=Hymenobacter chitinivorans DSM 11115 TaxID=1121954 RepID=A0A2M9BLE8_9BACT|nr:hypothetical protein [Hymenobacter chitinivorans]PJJ58774.1 hypothetical protein CLV45_0184 [Hymenobacter chitinivorans DSM 11115]
MKSITTYLAICAPLAVSLLATSCTVYTPMQPTVSTVGAKGELELTGSIQPNTRLESTVIYSPLPNTLVMAAGSFRPKIGDTTYSATRQWEAGLGSYVHLGPRWLLTGIAGYGNATTSKSIPGVGIGMYGGGYDRYKATYSKVFGQLSLAHQLEQQSFGVVYRLARVQYEQLDYSFGLNSDYAAIPMQKALRHEALAFYRTKLGQQDRWQLQATLGLSGATPQPTVEAPDGPNRNDNYTEQREARNASRAVLMTSLGVVFRPHLPHKTRPVQP